MIELLFNSKKELASNKEQKLTTIFEEWLKENSVFELLHYLNHQYVDFGVDSSKQPETLFKALEKIKKNIQIPEETQNNNNHPSKNVENKNTEKFLKLIDFYLENFQQSETASPIHLISHIIKFKDLVFESLKKEKYSKEQLKHQKKLIKTCDDLLYATISKVKTDNPELWLNTLRDQQEITLSFRDIFISFDTQEFLALIEQNLVFFKDKPYMVEKLGGKTIQVYKLRYGHEEAIIKVYPEYSDLTKAEESELEKVRELLDGSASSIIGKIYHQTEIVTLNSEHQLQKKGKLEFAEFFGEGNLEAKIAPFPAEALKRPSSPLSRLFYQDFVGFAISVVTAVKALEDLHIGFPDIKASNFLISDLAKQSVIISDFKTMRHYPTFPFVKFEDLIGVTEDYLPPEIKNAKREDEINLLHLDAYAIGLLIYELATGDTELKKNKNNAPSFSNKIFTQKPGLRTILESLLNPDPTKRMSLVEVLTELSQLSTPKNSPTHKRINKVKSSSHEILSGITDFNDLPKMVKSASSELPRKFKKIPDFASVSSSSYFDSPRIMKSSNKPDTSKKSSLGEDALLDSFTNSKIRTKVLETSTRSTSTGHLITEKKKSFLTLSPRLSKMSFHSKGSSDKDKGKQKITIAEQLNNNNKPPF